MSGNGQVLKSGISGLPKATEIIHIHLDLSGFVF